MKKHLIYVFIASILFLGIVTSPASAQTVTTVQSVQAAIKAAGATWVAGESRVSKLTPDAQKRLLGVLNAPNQNAKPAPASQAAYGLPPSLDWRNNGGNFVSGVRDQGNCGSCWAHASIAALESATLIANKTPNTELNLSEQALMSCCNSICSPSWLGQCAGGYPEKAADFLRNTGAATEACYPYTTADGLCATACPNWQASAYKIKSWEWVVNDEQDEQASVDAIKTGLQNGPMVIAMAVYYDFFYYTSGVYKRITGGLAGYHAILVVGYDDPGQYFIVKNSWGTDWGEQGFFRIAYSEVTGASQFGYQTIAYHVGDTPTPICAYDLGDSFPASGGTGTIQVTIDDGFAWFVSTNDYWITTSQPYQKGSGPATFTMAPNAASSARSGNVTFNAGTREIAYTIYQDAGSGPCTYAISPTSKSFDYKYNGGSISVTAGSGCPWTAVSTSFIDPIISGASGTGNGTVDYTFPQNWFAYPRTATIKVADKDFTVIQTGCSVSLAPASQNPGANGGTGTVTVTADSQCSWQASSNASWITITSSYNIVGNGTISYSVPANSGSSSRTGTITIGDKSFTVTQAGGSGCAYSLTPTSQSFNASSGNAGNSAFATVTMTASSPGCSWQAESHATWIGFSSAVTGSGSATITYRVEDNFQTSARTGTMTIGGQTFTVTQAGLSCIPTLSPTGQTFSAASGTGTFSVTAPSSCSWQTTSWADWITVTSGTSGTGNGTISYSVAPNSGTFNRGGYISVGQSMSLFAVNQAGSSSCLYGLGPGWATSPNWGFGPPAGSDSVDLNTTAPSCSWQVTSNAPWITITSPTSGKGIGKLAFSVAANTGAVRSGTITMTGGIVVNVSQTGPNNCTYTLSPTSQSFGPPSGTGTFTVTPSSSGCPWTASSSVPWITVSGGASGTGNGTVTYSLAANSDMWTRTGTIWVAATPFTVTQNSASCFFWLGSYLQNFSAANGTGTVTVSCNNTGCLWAASSSVPWITVTGGASGSGSGTVSYAVAASTGAPRSGTITIADKTFTVTQAGSTTCTYAISPTGRSFNDASGGTGSVTVTAASGCAWTASSTVPWITVTGGASGSGNGSFTYSVAANTGDQRYGTITVANQAFLVWQPGDTTCPNALTPTAQNFASAGGADSVFVTTPGYGCAWTATSSAPWISITSGSHGSASAKVGYSVDPNTNSTSRTGTITIGAKTLTVTQAGSGTCTYAISPTSNTFTAAAGTGTVNVTAGSGCSWSAVTNATSWLSVTSGASGSGNGSVGYSVTANTSTTSRTGTLTIAGQTFTVTQDGMSCTYALNPTSQSFTSASGTGTVNVTSASGCAWTATSGAAWITINSGASGSGNGTVSYSVAANTSTATRTGTSSRTGTLTIGGQTHTVTQAGQTCTYSITPASQSFTSATGTGTVNLTTDSGCPWTATSNASWITVSSGASGSGNGTVSYSVTANTSTASRTGTMTIAGQTFTVSQAGQSCTYTLNPTSQSFTSGTGSGTVNVTTASGCAWTASSNASWITVVSGSNGSSNGSVNYSVGANASTSSRTGSMTIAGQTFTVSQAGMPTCSTTLNTGGFNLGYMSRQAMIQVYASCSWSASTNVPWITFVSGANGTGNGTATFAVDTNPGAARTGTITIGTSTVSVNQAGSSTCTYTLSSTSQSFGAGSGTGSVNVAASSSNCSWTAASTASWITVTRGASGTGSGSVTYSVGANSSTSRTGTITIAGQTFTVSQAGTTTCTYSINPTSQSFSAGSGTGSVTITSASGCAWTAGSNASWISITSGTNGTGSGAVGYSVGANTGTSRTGTLSIAGQTFTVSQAGGSSSCGVFVWPAEYTFDAPVSVRKIGVTADSTCAWTITSNASWLKIASGESGQGKGTFSLSVDANTGPSRTGTLTVNGTIVTVTQKGAAGK